MSRFYGSVCITEGAYTSYQTPIKAEIMNVLNARVAHDCMVLTMHKY